MEQDDDAFQEKRKKWGLGWGGGREGSVIRIHNQGGVRRYRPEEKGLIGKNVLKLLTTVDRTSSSAWSTWSLGYKELGACGGGSGVGTEGTGTLVCL